MATISATDAKNKIGELWAMADREPVTIERNGIPKYQLIATDSYVAIPIEDYNRLMDVRRAPRFGFAREELSGLDVDALLAVDVSDEFEGGL